MKLCVFCGAKQFVDQKFKTLAADFGKEMARKGITLVYGGSKSGLMATISDTVIKNNGKVIGIYPKILYEREPMNMDLTQSILVDTMSVRKEVMIANADAFLVLPGGIGTLDELFEVLTLKDLGAHHKPVILLNYDGYWDKLIDLCNYLVETKFANESLPHYFKVAKKVDDVFKILSV